MMTWQPIETVPRDGTGVLLLSPEGDVGIGFICTDVFGGLTLITGPAAWYGQRLYERKPSLWMGRFPAEEAVMWQPLPEPPEQKP